MTHKRFFTEIQYFFWQNVYVYVSTYICIKIYLCKKKIIHYIYIYIFTVLPQPMYIHYEMHAKRFSVFKLVAKIFFYAYCFLYLPKTYQFIFYLNYYTSLFKKRRTINLVVLHEEMEKKVSKEFIVPLGKRESYNLLKCPWLCKSQNLISSQYC